MDRRIEEPCRRIAMLYVLYVVPIYAELMSVSFRVFSFSWALAYMGIIAVT